MCLTNTSLKLNILLINVFITKKKIQIFINPILKFKLCKDTNLTAKKLIDVELKSVSVKIKNMTLRIV